MLLTGDCRDILPTLDAESVVCCVTSPPYYGLRDYGVEGQIGMEETPAAYVQKLVEVFREVKRVLQDNGTLWLNLGDSYCNTNGYARAQPAYQRKGRNDAPANDRNLDALHNAGFKTKDLIGIPWRVAFALQADGWYLRQDIIWSKPNPMPESVTDRCTKSHEYIFLFSKSPKYYFDAASIAESCITNDKSSPRGSAGCIGNQNSGRRLKTKYGESQDEHHATYSGNVYTQKQTRNKRDVWAIPTQPFSGAHFATYPEELVRNCILAGCPLGGTVLDPFSGSGTTGKVALDLGRQYIGIELNPDYVKLSQKRVGNYMQKSLSEVDNACQ